MLVLFSMRTVHGVFICLPRQCFFFKKKPIVIKHKRYQNSSIHWTAVKGARTAILCFSVCFIFSCSYLSYWLASQTCLVPFLMEERKMDGSKFLFGFWKCPTIETPIEFPSKASNGHALAAKASSQFVLWFTKETRVLENQGKSNTDYDNLTPSTFQCILV